MPLGTERQEDFSAGEQRDVSPHLIDPRGVYALENGLLNDDGSVYKRGGSQAVSTAPLGLHGRMAWSGWLAPGRRTFMGSSDRFGVLAEDGKSVIDLGGGGVQLPATATAVQDILFVGGGVMYGGSRKLLDYSTGSVSVTAGSPVVTGAGTAFLANVDAGMLLVVGAGRPYVVAAIQSDTQLTLRGNYEEATAGGRTYALKRTVANAERPIVTQAAQRLVVCNGNEVLLSLPKNPFSTQETIQTAGGPVTVQAKHEIEEGAKIITAASLGVDKALIFSTAGVTTMSNLAATIVDANGNSQHRIDKISADIVAWGPAGISAYRNALVVPALDDVYLMDGVSEPVPLSHSIDPSYQAYVLEGFVPGQSWVYRDHFFLPILDAAGDPVDLLVCRLDRPFSSRGRTFYPWARLSGGGAKIAGAAVQPAAGAGDLPHVYGACNDGNLVDLAPYFAPGLKALRDHDDSIPLFSLTTRDFPAGDISIGRFRRFRLIYELEVEKPLPEGISEEERTAEEIEREEREAKEVEEGRVPGQAFITLEVGTGIRQEGGALWDEVDWDEFLWAAGDEETQFLLLEGGAEPNIGQFSAFAQNAKDWFLNTHARYARFRLQSADPVARLTIRTIEIFVAQTGGVRQAKVIDRK